MSLQCPDALPFLWKHFTALRGKVERKAHICRKISELFISERVKKGDSLYVGTLKFIFIRISQGAGFIVE